MLRHSTAHVMAEAVQHLWPDAKIAIGPAIDDGFYYDFEFPEPSPRTTSSGSRTRCGGSSPRARTRSSAADGARARRDRRASAPRDEPYKVELAEGLPEGEEIT